MNLDNVYEAGYEDEHEHEYAESILPGSVHVLIDLQFTIYRL